MRNIIAFVVALCGILLGLYTGGWLLFIQPIISVCRAFDAGTLTATIIGITIIKCICAGAVGFIIAYIGILVAGCITSLK
jgi:hypothetical protein